MEARKRRSLLEVAIRFLKLRSRLCGFTRVHGIYSGTSMEEEPWFLDMNPGFGLAAEVRVVSQPEEICHSKLALLSWIQKNSEQYLEN